MAPVAQGQGAALKRRLVIGQERLKAEIEVDQLSVCLVKQAMELFLTVCAHLAKLRAKEIG